MKSFSFLKAVIIIIFLLTGTKSGFADNDGDEFSYQYRPKTVGGYKIPPGYDKHKIPSYSIYGNETMKTFPVIVSLYIRSVLDVDEEAGEIVIDADWTLEWKDFTMLSFIPPEEREAGDHMQFYALDSEILKYIWKPDIFIEEVAKADRAEVTSKLVQFMVYGGYFVYSSRVQLRLRCNMDFTYYPADTQHCQYRIRSYSYESHALFLFWTKVGVEENHRAFLEDSYNPNFEVTLCNVEPFEKDFAHLLYEGFNLNRRGKYSLLSFELKARRRLSYHLVLTYLPSILLICVTCSSFLLPSDMIEARIGVTMTTLLTGTAMFAAVKQQCPKVSYTMAIDVWMVHNMFSIFYALALFTVIYWMKKRISRQPKIDSINRETLTETLYEKLIIFTKKRGFTLFVSTFLTFAIIYWVVLIHLSGYLEWEVDPEFNALDDDGSKQRILKYACSSWEKYVNNTDQVWMVICAWCPNKEEDLLSACEESGYGNITTGVYGLTDLFLNQSLITNSGNGNDSIVDLFINQSLITFSSGSNDTIDGMFFNQSLIENGNDTII